MVQRVNDRVKELVNEAPEWVGYSTGRDYATLYPAW